MEWDKYKDGCFAQNKRRVYKIKKILLSGLIRCMIRWSKSVLETLVRNQFIMDIILSEYIQEILLQSTVVRVKDHSMKVECICFNQSMTTSGDFRISLITKIKGVSKHLHALDTGNHPSRRRRINKTTLFRYARWGELNWYSPIPEVNLQIVLLIEWDNRRFNWIWSVQSHYHGRPSTVSIGGDWYLSPSCVKHRKI